MNQKYHVEDVAAASAAHAFNILPGISALPAPEAYRRLYDLFHTALTAFVEAGVEWQVVRVPAPSEN